MTDNRAIMNIIYVSNSTVVKQGRNDVQMTKSKWNNDSTGNVVTNYVEIISSPKYLGLILIMRFKLFTKRLTRTILHYVVTCHF